MLVGTVCALILLGEEDHKIRTGPFPFLVYMVHRNSLSPIYLHFLHFVRMSIHFLSEICREIKLFHAATGYRRKSFKAIACGTVSPSLDSGWISGDHCVEDVIGGIECVLKSHVADA